MNSGAILISKKIKEQGFLRQCRIKKSHQKTCPLDPGSEIREPEKIHPGSGSRIKGIKSTGSRILIRNTAQPHQFNAVPALGKKLCVRLRLLPIL
jgi:hypothetical protein